MHSLPICICYNLFGNDKYFVFSVILVCDTRMIELLPRMTLKDLTYNF